MKKALAAAFILIVTAGLIIGFFWLQSSEDRRKPGSERASALVELGVALEAQEGSADPDGPIFLSLGLASPRVINLLAHAGPDAMNDLPDLTIGTADSPWWSEIQLIAYQEEDERELSWTRLSQEAEPVADLSDGFGRSIRVVVEPGGLDLRGSLRLHTAMRWNEQVLISNELDLDVIPNSIDATRKATLFTRFFLETGQLDNAQSSVEELVRLQPREPKTFALRARVLEETGDLAEAQRSWVQAIELLPEGMEEPTVIYFARLRAVEERLAADAAADRSR